MHQLTLFHPSKNHKRPIRRRAVSEKGNTAQTALWNSPADADRELALFFLDIRGFTSLIEKRRAVDVIYLVKKLFSRFQAIIRSHHGRIIETSGDGFYAAFGFDRDSTEAVRSAVQAGKVILNTLENLSELRGERIDVGIGIHTGRVAVGSLHVGSGERTVVMGHPVNIAARLQAATKEFNNNFVVSEEVFRMLNDPSLNPGTANSTLKGVKESRTLYLIGKAYAE